MMKKIVLVTLITMIGGFSLAQDNSPVEIIEQYDEAYLNNDWQKVAQLTNPVELTLFRNSIKINQYEIAAADANTNIDSIHNLSDMNLYAIFLNSVYSKAPTAKIVERKFIIGTLYEKNSYAYVVYKDEKKDVGMIELENFNNEWKMGLDLNLRWIFVGLDYSSNGTSESENNFSNNFYKYNSNNESEPPVKDSEIVKSTISQLSELMTDENFVSQLAVFSKKYYDALLKEGFAKEEALQIISGSKSLFQNK
ncbi:MAG: hypothetical protein WAU11_09675 [Ignavibacteriaceae bacterium]